MRIISLAATLAFLAGAHAPVHATVLNFDDLNPPDGFGSTRLSDIDSSDYGGLTWSAGWGLAATVPPGSPLFSSAAHSGERVLFNFSATNNLIVSSASAFDFAGAWFAAADFNAPESVSEWVNITAYDFGDNFIGTTGEVSIGVDPIWIAAGFTNAAYLIITREQGLFAMDDFTFTLAEPSEVPLPAALPLFLCGLGGIMALRRRQRGD